MQIKVDPSVIGQTRWYEYAIRFLFGELITAVAGIIAKKFGPGIGGLFLAYPAILPASATLIENMRSRKKRRKGYAELSVDERQPALMPHVRRWGA
jgi:hypothetical protein